MVSSCIFMDYNSAKGSATLLIHALILDLLARRKPINIVLGCPSFTPNPDVRCFAPEICDREKMRRHGP